MSKHYDIIIVGAGVQGLSAANTFLAIDASLTILILDSKATLGGVWAKEQLYPGLRANSLQGYYEFSDYPILEAGLESYGVGPRSILSGDAVYAYLQKFAKHFNLVQRMRLNTTVLCATNNEDGAIRAWALDITTSGAEDRLTYSKLIIATGQASKPLLPDFPGADMFTKPIIHSVRLGETSKSIIPDPAVEHVTVIGGSKSAHDTVFMLATAGKHVTWLTRRSGRGTILMANIYSQIGPFKIWLQGLLMTRS
jgi:cation diffusion facilitator CzcD-associated flavoprotein CzcO